MAAAVAAAGVVVGGQVIGAALGGVAGAYGAQAEAEANKASLRAQMEAEAEKLEQQKALNLENFNIDKEKAAMEAGKMRERAAQTQKEADNAYTSTMTQLGAELDKQVLASKNANIELAQQAAQGETTVLGMKNIASTRGLKFSGGLSKATAITAMDVNDSIQQGKTNLDAQYKAVETGAKIIKTGADNSHDTAMFNKTQLLNTANEMDTAYREGGLAYRAYQANDVYTSQLAGIESRLQQKNIDYINNNLVWGMVLGGISGATGGANLGGTIGSWFKK